MGEKDLSENYLESYNDVFADIINVLLCDGKQIIKQEHLEADGNKTIYKADEKIHEQERDIAKFWKDGHIKIALLGLENQTNQHPYMPLRVMGYDGASYRTQILKEHEQEEKYPVISIVLYFGMERWKAPRTLRECFQNIPEELSKYVNDYKVHVFEIAYLTPQQVEMFQSDFKIVADYFVQLRTNKTYVPGREVIEHVDAVLKLMSVLTRDERFEEFQNSGKGEAKTMCEVLDNAIDQGIAQGIERGEAIKLIEQVCKKMQKEKTVEEIADSLEESEETIERIYQVALKYHANVEEKEKIFEELNAALQVVADGKDASSSKQG